jgi:hypothetical protein
LFAPSIISHFQLCVIANLLFIPKLQLLQHAGQSLTQKLTQFFSFTTCKHKTTETLKSHYFLTNIRIFLPVLPHLPLQNAITNSDVSKDSKPSNNKNWTYMLDCVDSIALPIFNQSGIKFALMLQFNGKISLTGRRKCKFRVVIRELMTH